MNKFSENRDINLSKFISLFKANKHLVIKITTFFVLFFMATYSFLPKNFSTFSIIYPYKNQPAAGSFFANNNLASTFLGGNSTDLSRLYEDLFKGYDFINGFFDSPLPTQNGQTTSIADILKYNSEYPEELNDEQINFSLFNSFINDNIIVNYDSFTGLFFVEFIFNSPDLSYQIHNELISQFDLYLSDLKNKKIALKNVALNEEIIRTKKDLDELEDLKKNFLKSNKSILQSPELSSKLYNIERDIKLLESSFIALYTEEKMNEVNTSLKGNNFRIIQQPILPLKPNLSRSSFTLLGLFLGLFFSSIIIFYQYLKR